MIFALPLQVDDHDSTLGVVFPVGDRFEWRVRVNWKLQARPYGVSGAPFCLFPATYLLDDERGEHRA